MQDLNIHAARPTAATQHQTTGSTFTPAQKAEVVNQVGGDSWGC